ncbi:TIGR02444 family protein [Ferrimonas marina]|uniref:TIGR02444 family protein n=1 Tax=Ferrimonas marina TaxID=299255 RepID=A0A1M5ZPE7_9GAMM|nr:TIGR02444 family protein [Ferrimonas marina]SHI26157.1 TIGR02444 family protein [Ferrimonas marina]
MQITPEAFWQFSESLWQHAEARQTALAMQDRYRLEPNLLLLALMLEQQGQFLNQAQFEALNQAQANWQQKMLEPYRRLRRLAKNSLPDDSYQQMLEVELVMERRGQQLLLKALATLQPAAEGDNLDSCLRAQDIEPNALPGDLLAQLSQLFQWAEPPL